MKRIMKFWWILVLLAIVLLVWGIRERFEPTESIKAPPYDGAEKVRVFNMALQRSTKAPYNFLGYQDTLLSKAKEQHPNETDQTKLKEFAGGLVTPTLEEFFRSVYKPATVPITEEQIDTFLATRSSDIKDIEKQILKTYFIDQGGVGTGMRTGYAEELAKMGQNYGYMRPNAPGEAATGPAGETGTTSSNGEAPVCPAGYQDESNGRGPNLRCVKRELGEPTCPAGSTIESTLAGPRCNDSASTQPTCSSGTVTGRGDGTFMCADTILISRTSSGATAPGATAPGATGPGATAPGATGGNTTGGSTTTSGMNATGSGVTPASVRKSTILGPVFTSYGAPLEGNGSPDSYKSNQYPELLGGGDPAARNRMGPGSGVGGGGFGMNIELKGSMPTAESLGSTEESKFFPFSRQPGDMELIPDPYRVSQQFSSASYSFKTEPTPFLTDFSAFLR